MDELKTLQGENFTLSTGEVLQIKPVGFGKLSLFSEAVSRLAGKLSENGMDLESISDWKAVFDIAFEEIVNIMGIVLGKERAFFDEIDLADGLGLLDIIVRQNFDNDRAKKNLKNLISRFSSLLPMLSKPSSARGTVGKKSMDTASKKLNSSQGASSN